MKMMMVMKKVTTMMVMTMTIMVVLDVAMVKCDDGGCMVVMGDTFLLTFLGKLDGFIVVMSWNAN